MTNTEVTIIDSIKAMYKKLNDKQAFIVKIAPEFRNKPQSIANHWFGGFWSIPEDHQSKVAELLQIAVEEQNQKVSA